MAIERYDVCWLRDGDKIFVPKTVLESISTVSGQDLKDYIALQNLSDATIIEPVNLQALLYNSEKGKWENSNIKKLFSNKDTLDEFSEDKDGDLLFKGEKIKGGGGYIEEITSKDGDMLLSEYITQRVLSILEVMDTITDIEEGDIYKIDEPPSEESLSSIWQNVEENESFGVN